MAPATTEFIASSTLLFIASRNARGELDVSPRGGQPCVVRLSGAGEILLPDYVGNRRLDTIGNLLANPETALAILKRDCAAFLRVLGTARVSFDPAHLEAFPADDNPPISVLVITPRRTEFVTTEAFDRMGFWRGAELRRPPLDLGGLVGRDKAAQLAAGFAPVLKPPEEERFLAEAGVRSVYGLSSEGVQTKVCDMPGPSGLEFIARAGFVVLAHRSGSGGLSIDLLGEGPLTVIPFNNRHAFRLRLPPRVGALADGESALVTVSPGQNEVLRVNGRFEVESGAESGAAMIVPREVFFHCPAAFSRARLWQRDRRTHWTGKRRFTCAARRIESPEVTSFILRPVDQAPIGPVAPGQYVTIALPDGSAAPAQRSYSVSGRPDARSLRISVRRLGLGGISDRLHTALQPGSEILVSIPAGRFVLDSPPGRRVALVSAGVGITPLLPMLEALAGEDGHGGREVWFIHAARDSRHHLFAEEARALAGTAGDRMHLVSAWSRPLPGERAEVTGRLDAGVLARLFPVAQTDVYLCGPSAFMSGLREGLVAAGADPASVRFESFEGAGGLAMDLSGTATAQAGRVTFRKSGKTRDWTPGEGSLLDMALREKIDAAHSCRVGDCQSCAQRLVSGLVDYPSGEIPMLAEDQVLMCQAIPCGDVVLDC